MAGGIKATSYKSIKGHFLGHDKEPRHKIATKRQAGKNAVVHSHSKHAKRTVKGAGSKSWR